MRLRKGFIFVLSPHWCNLCNFLNLHQLFSRHLHHQKTLIYCAQHFLSIWSCPSLSNFVQSCQHLFSKCLLPLAWTSVQHHVSIIKHRPCHPFFFFYTIYSLFFAKHLPHDLFPNRWISFRLQETKRVIKGVLFSWHADIFLHFTAKVSHQFYSAILLFFLMCNNL